jgi:hypothetical protein
VLNGNVFKSAFLVGFTIRQLAEKSGVERLGFLTLTFRDDVQEIREASRRYNSLATHVLRGRYVATMTVRERTKRGRIHLHLIVVLPGDIRTGFDFAAIAKGDYRSANPALRSEWAFWRKTAPAYGFGRTELLPVKSTAEGVSKYVGKYLAKHHFQREEADKGARLVSYSSSARAGSTRFSFLSPKATLWRTKLARFAERLGFAGNESGFYRWAREVHGPKWAHLLGEMIAAEVVPVVVRVGGVEVARSVPPVVSALAAPAPGRFDLRKRGLRVVSEGEGMCLRNVVWLPAGADFPDTLPKWTGSLSGGRPHGGRSSGDSLRPITKDGPALYWLPG